MKSQLLALTFLLSVNTASAAIIGIVDSGNDFGHKDLAAKAWINPIEIPSNDRDEDKNGYPDDVNGWNFAEANNMLIDYSYAWSDTSDVRRFFDIQLKSFMGTLTEEDREWANTKLKDEKFIKEITVFGNWMHGTHVTGIAARMSADAKMIGMKLIPTEVKLPGQKSNMIVIKTGNSEARFDISFDKKETPIRDALLKGALTALAKQQAVIYTEMGLYLKNAKADVMNGSFGTSYQAISGIIAMLFETMYRRPPTDLEIKKFTDHYFAVSLEETKSFLKSSPNTLFIFAAGNDGTNNDVVPTSPTNVIAENKISVAASLGNQDLAVFSNYGEKNVEVAAPGVGIVSTSPQNKYIPVSGTSQAAPYVAGIAGAVKDMNGKLNFKDIKKIILETVDVKPWLKGKVLTSGIVNKARAVRAAELSRTMDLSKAIAQAKVDVLAETFNERLSRRYYQVPKSWVMPLPSMIVLK